MAESTFEVICPSAALLEAGQAQVFDVNAYGEPARAFVLRYDGQVVGYLNRCAHMPVEMDWQPGHFLDDQGQFIVCSMHGAVYHPQDGRCAGGPCTGGSLVPLCVQEVDGQVRWYPCDGISPAFTDL